MTSPQLHARMCQFLEQALARFGPRESCSAAEKQLGQWLVQRWSALGWTVRTESFSCHPHAFLGFIPFTALFYFVTVATYWVAPWVSVAVGIVLLAVTYLELLRYRELLDPLFPQRQGENILAVLPARGQARQRVLVSAHRDSAYEFHLWYWLKNAAVPLMVVAFLAPLIPTLGAFGQIVFGLSADHWLFRVAGYLGVALTPIVACNLVFHSYRTVPGAMDDLAGVAVLDGLAARLASDRARDTALEHTEVWLLATSAEEAGLRGAKRFARTHRDELNTLPTFGLFVDGVCDERHLTAVRHEVTTGVRHSPRLVELARRIAKARQWHFHNGIIPFGATDASAFRDSGIETVALLCQDTTRLVPNYHTRLDTLDHVRPESLVVVLELVYEMVLALDRDRAAPPVE